MPNRSAEACKRRLQKIHKHLSRSYTVDFADRFPTLIEPLTRVLADDAWHAAVAEERARLVAVDAQQSPECFDSPMACADCTDAASDASAASAPCTEPGYSDATPRTEPATPAIDAPCAEPSPSPSLSEAAGLAKNILDVCKQLVDQPMMHAQAAHDTCAAVSSSLAAVSGEDNLCMLDASDDEAKTNNSLELLLLRCNAQIVEALQKYSASTTLNRFTGEAMHDFDATDALRLACMSKHFWPPTAGRFPTALYEKS